jgi:hypothetical protein
VRAASCLGFTVTLPEDACYTYDKADYLGTMRPTSDWHLMTLSNLHGEYAAVRRTDEILAGPA